MDGGILVVSSPDGPMPQTKEHILPTRQVGFLMSNYCSDLLYFSVLVQLILPFFSKQVYIFVVCGLLQMGKLVIVEH